MGDSEPSDSDLSLEECVAKAHELTRYKPSDPANRAMLDVWVATHGPMPKFWQTRADMNRFLRQPMSPSFGMTQRRWHAKFLKFHLAVAIARLKG